MHTNDKIYVAGHTGMVGSAIVRRLGELGCRNLVLKTRKELDLTNYDQVSAMLSSVLTNIRLKNSCSWDLLASILRIVHNQ